MKIYRNAFIALIAASVSLTSARAQEDRFEVKKLASVNVNKLVDGYHKVPAVRDQFTKYKEEVYADAKKREDEVRALIEEARELQQQAEDSSLPRDRKTELLSEANVKQKKAQRLQSERVKWEQRKSRALAEKAKLEFQVLRDEVLDEIRAFGIAEGYDLVLDRSATSGQQVPVLSFSKDATDLTLVLLEKINEGAEEAPAEVEEAEQGQ